MAATRGDGYVYVTCSLERDGELYCTDILPYAAVKYKLNLYIFQFEHPYIYVSWSAAVNIGFNYWCLFALCHRCIVTMVMCVRMFCVTVLSSELQTDSLVCDCRLEWFIKWMLTRQKSSRLRVSELAVCGIPTALKGTLLKELTIEDLHCGECYVQN